MPRLPGLDRLPGRSRTTDPNDLPASPSRTRAVAVRAAAGGVLLLGVTAGVGALTGAQAPVTPTAALPSVTALAPVTALDDPALRRQVLSGEARAQALIDQARQRAAQEASRSAARRAERAAAVRREAARREAARREDARREARQKREAARERAARARTVAPTGDPRSTARRMLAARGWSGQFGCLDALWQRESNWNHRAVNPSSGAYGIPQALPAGKMASAGADWRTNPATQIRWGLDYIAERYGSPCAAWGHSQSRGWY